jgi:hypothetical protein
MPYFLIAMFYIYVKQVTSNKNLGKSHPFLSFRNLFTNIHAFWVTFNYNICANHAFNTRWQQASWIAYICMWLKSYMEIISHPW